MTAIGLIQILFFFLIILALTKPVGAFMAKVFQGERTFLHPVLRPLERLIYRLSGVREEVEQHWTHYAGAVLAISIAKFVFTYLIQRLQGFLPLNPQGFSTANAAQGATPLTPDLAFNTAVSFMTNTNWQSYVGETTVSYFVQMAALTVQNFTSAAAGIAIAIALVRGFARHETKTIGNFWVDFTRATVYILLPLSIVGALIFASQGVIQNWDAYTQVNTLEGATQTIAQGPVASQEAIKQLGTNGGGFFNANSSHPFENPTPLSTTLQIVLIFVLPAGLTYTFGMMVKDTPPGLGAVRGDERDVLPRRLRRPTGPSSAEIRFSPSRASKRPQRTRRPAATWKARKSASASPSRRSSPRSPPTPAAAPSTACTTATRRSAVSCRFSTCRRAK